MMDILTKRNFIALICGLLFGVGLILSGMANPQKVINFLDVAGQWDPTLMFVLGGATGMTVLLYPFVFKQHVPLFDVKFYLPATNKIDPQLVFGAALFGMGWGAVGLCPGPVYTALLLGRSEPIIFFAAMIIGMALFRYRNPLINLVRRAKTT